jgi:hypothetical protein
LKPFKLLWKPFNQQFGDVIDKFRNHRDNLEKEAGLAHMIEEAGERKAQSDERAIALVGRQAEEAARKGTTSNSYQAIRLSCLV